MMDGRSETVPHLVHDKKCSFWKNLHCFGIRKNRVNQFLDSNAWRVLSRHDCSFVAVKSSNGDMFLSSHPPLTCALHLINTRKLGKNAITFLENFGKSNKYGNPTSYKIIYKTTFVFD